MSRITVSMFTCVLVVLIAAATNLAAPGNSNDGHWPQWRGPLGTGASETADPPVKWSDSQGIKWKVAIPGRGNAAPIIWGDRVFIQTAIATGKKVEVAEKADARDATPVEPPAPSAAARLLNRFDVNKDGTISRAEVPEGAMRGMFDRMAEQYKLDPAKAYPRSELEKIFGAAQRPEGERPQRPRGGMRSARPTEAYQFVLMCLDRETGKTIWQKVAREEVPHEGHHASDGTFASASPVTDGTHIFAYFGSRGLYCYDFSGNLQWSKDLGDMRVQNTFGEGSSPVLCGGAIVINWDHEGDSFITALDKKTGETLWKTVRDERTSWSTPIAVQHSGKLQVITTATRKIRSYDAASGDVIWECSGLTRNVIPSPVSSNGVVYAMSGFQGNSLLAIRLGQTGDVSESDAVVWTHRRGTPYVPSPLLYRDKLYFFASNNGILTCIDAKDGRTLIDSERLRELQGVYASPVAAAGRVYLVGRNGVTMVLSESETLDVLATNRLDDRIDASPALAGKELYLRGHEYLYCIAER